MKLRLLSTLALTSTVLSSCVYYTQPVPEMPYSTPGSQRTAAMHTNTGAYAAAAQYEGAWSTTQPAMLPTANPYSSSPYAANPYATNPYASTPYTATTSQPPRLAPLPIGMANSVPTTIPVPATQTTPKPSTAITQPQLKLNPITPKPAEAAKPAPAPKPAAAAPKPAIPAPADTAKDPKTITNNGPIPVATPVPGDPTRVYNPLDSSKTIRITDKNGKIYPSGKELKVRGTNFHFYVP